ncbi:MAG TPA: tetratricopeptide repeat protein [Trichormus sp. M33_DOE_039]|nr:tetratricopeptide repeat protein [Trichormus sp. M33_DOE_039]
MNQNSAIITFLIFFLSSSFSFVTLSPLVTKAAIETASCESKAENGETGEYSTQQLKTLASRITVRVIGDKNGGSGTLLGKQGNTYLVLTNSHVIRGVKSINLQTSDGKIYSAQIVPNTNFEKFDLALLQFQTNQNYCLQEIANFLPDSDTQVIAAGYSSAKGEIVFSTGTVQKIWDIPLKEGYQIGYTSDIEQGMSGGVILSSVGQIIGVNGRSAYPILNTGYVYPDGSRPSDAEIQQMRQLSWGIPISTFLAQVKPDILTAYSLPLPQSQPNVPTTQLTGWLEELEQKAKQISVRIDSIRIDSNSNANGSGIIIAKDGDTYTVLTAAHVVCERQDYTQPCGNFKYQILAPDGKQYPVEKSTIKTEEGVDLGIVKFTAPNQNYQVATLANYNPNNLDYMFTAGYPRLGNSSPWRLTMGQTFEKEQGLLQSRQSDFQTDSSGKLQTASSSNGGYELVYTSITYGGMSGGAVLDSQGRVIGIHGRAEGEQVFDEKTGDRGSSGGKVQLGYSLGIPVDTFLGLAKRFGVQALHVETNPASPLNIQQVKSIQEAVLSIDISQGNATASQWLERGNQLWRLGRDSEAVKAFDEAIKLKPAFVYLAYYGKGLALSWDGKHQESIAAFESATKLKPDFVTAWQTLSLVYRVLKQPEKALVAIEKAIQLQPKNPDLYNEKWTVLDNLKRYAEAELAINKAIEINPRAAFYNNRGNLYADQKKWDLALADFNQVITINPQNATAYYNRGYLYADQKKWDLALADFNQAIIINSQYADAYNNRGILYYDQKKWDLALVDFNQAIAINPQGATAYINRGVLYKEQKKWDLALADYTKAIAINPQGATAYNNRGILYYDQKKWDLALADYTTAIAINPQYVDAYKGRGNLYYDQKKWDLALADYTKAIAINPQYVDAYYNRGVLYYNQKKWDLSEADYTQAISINPLLAEAYYNRGVLYYNQKKWDLALADYTQAIAINPQDVQSYYNRGVLYYNQKKWDLAEVDYTQAIAINPLLVEAYYNRGVLYYNQKKWDLALADYTQAIVINPLLAEAYYSRGVLYYSQKKWDLAEADYIKAITINPQYTQAYYNRGVLYYRQKKWDLALADYNQAIAVNPQYFEAYYNRGNLYYDQKRWDLALADYNQAIAVNPQYFEAYYNRGNLYYDQKRWDLALADYNQAIKINTDYAFAYASRGSVYVNLGDKQKAIKDLKQAAQLFQDQGNNVSYETVMNFLKKLQQ